MALEAHFLRASTNKKRTSVDQQMYSGLLTRVRSPEFLQDLSLTYDTLYELAALSEYLQNRRLTLVSADRAIRRTIRCVGYLEKKPGTKMLEAKTATSEGQFGTLKLESNWRHVPINESKFFET